MKTLLGAMFSCVVVVIISLPVRCTADTYAAPQGSGSDAIYADGLKLVKQAPRTYLLTWDAYQVDPCENRATYDVYRGTREDFDPSAGTLVARELSGRSFASHEPSDHDYYYLVIVHLVSTPCLPRSGSIEVFPLDLGTRYEISAGTLADTCTAQSTTEIWCPSIKEMFHAVIGEQWATNI